MDFVLSTVYGLCLEYHHPKATVETSRCLFLFISFCSSPSVKPRWIPHEREMMMIDMYDAPLKDTRGDDASCVWMHVRVCTSSTQTRNKLSWQNSLQKLGHVL
jgi:hypothetical protein